MNVIPRAISYFLFVALLALCASTSAWALRCNSRVIDVGDTKGKVLYNCGEPESIETWEELIPWTHYKTYRYRDGATGYAEGVRVAIERWTYNFGPHRFIRYMQFENGILKKITIGEYGY